MEDRKDGKEKSWLGNEAVTKNLNKYVQICTEV